MSLRPRRNMKRLRSPEEDDNSSGADFEDVISNNAKHRKNRQSSKKPCLNRNALMARANRERKKAYIEKIENKLSFYQKQNEQLTDTVQKQSATIKRLTSEVVYLRSIVNNSTAITSLLNAINRNLSKPNNKQVQRTVSSTCEDVGSLSTSSRTSCNINKEELNRKNLPAKNNTFSFSNVDHAYMQTNNTGINNAEEIIMPSMNHMADDNYSEVKDISLESFSSAKPDNFCDDNIMGSIMKDDLSTDLDLDQLPSVNVDIFDDLQKYDEAVIANDILPDGQNFFKEEDLFRNLNDAGICLHLNSDRVSLEFCPSCHLNSTNSGVD